MVNRACNSSSTLCHVRVMAVSMTYWLAEPEWKARTRPSAMPARRSDMTRKPTLLPYCFRPKSRSLWLGQYLGARSPHPQLPRCPPSRAPGLADLEGAPSSDECLFAELSGDGAIAKKATKHARAEKGIRYTGCIATGTILPQRAGRSGDGVIPLKLDHALVAEVAANT